LSSPITPSAYSITLEREDGIVLSVLLEETADGESPHAAVSLGTLYAPMRGNGRTVEHAVNELAGRLEAYAASLRRMAPHLPAFPEKS
jgi:hypothetical protein